MAVRRLSAQRLSAEDGGDGSLVASTSPGADCTAANSELMAG